MRLNISLLGGAALLVVAAAHGCGSGGGGGSEPAGDSSLTLQALWQDTADVATTTGAVRATADQQGGFGTNLPGIVQTIRFVFRSEDADFNCCLAVSREVALDADRRVVLEQLPAGLASIEIAGFASASAPLPPDVDDGKCPSDPDAAPCTGGDAVPAFRSDREFVTLIPNVLVDAGTIEIFSVPFIPEGTLNPAPNGSILPGEEFSFTLVDPSEEIDPTTVKAEVLQGGEPIPLSLAADACDDEPPPDDQPPPSDPCTAGGALGVSGFNFTGTPPPGLPNPGPARVHITGENVDGVEFDFTYEITVRARPTITPTPVPTATPTSSLTPTLTPTPTATFTPGCGNTVLEEPEECESADDCNLNQTCESCQCVGTGDVRVTLIWAGINDLDLHVVDPFEEEIYYENPLAESGGMLDIDARNPCPIPSPGPPPINVENVFWPTEQAPAGTYEAHVNYFRQCDDSEPTTAFQVQVFVNGEQVEVVPGSTDSADDSCGVCSPSGCFCTFVTSFTVPQ